ncbi:MAG: signal peptide peptidase SppA, partial [Micavibrio aeruginosavorus]
MSRRFGSFFYQTKSRHADAAVVRKRSGVLPFIGGFIRKACLFIGAIVLFAIVMGIIAGAFFGGASSSDLPKKMVLVLNITDPIGETETIRSMADPFAPAGLTAPYVIEALDRAAKDSRVQGVLVSLDAGGMQLTHIQELRAAVKRFRLSGKFAHIYSASFADLGSGTGAYYFASAFDKIWMQPVGMVSLTGLSIEMPFAKEALGKLGARAEFLQREDYKSAMESFTRDSMSPENREMMTSILADFSDQIFKDIAVDRGLTNDALKAVMDKGLLTGDDALTANLVTNLDYADALLDSVQGDKKGTKSEVPLVALEDYADAVAKPVSIHAANVALVRVSGEIVPGDDAEPGYATSDYIAEGIREAAENEAIKVILVRIDSPGGSPTASETIRRAIVKAKAEGKKVIVSMGPVAASGGYWVAVDADRIYAMPSTLTGSIGVLMGKFELSGLWEKLGVHWDTISEGENAQIWSMNKPLSESERAALENAIDNTYDSFLTRVAEGRKMKKEEVREIARGRAWTGLQAKERGLVDEIGGMDAAL